MILELALPYAPVVVVVVLWAFMRPVRHLLHPVPAANRSPRHR
jgi:hypothetical protein